MKYYELTCLISPNLSEQELNSFSEKINSLVQDQGAILDKILPEKKIVLGSPIEKNTSAFFKILTFNLNPEKLIDLEKKLKENKEILRYFILAKKEPSKEILFKRQVKKPETLKPVIPEITKDKPKKKVELKDIDKKLKEILEE
jgi:small subunit ribosomal protein S6